MDEVSDRLDGIDLVGAAKKIEVAIGKGKRYVAPDTSKPFLMGFDHTTRMLLVTDIRKRYFREDASNEETDEMARMLFQSSLVTPKGIYWFDETLDETMERLAEEGEEPTDEIQWIPRAVIASDPDVEEKARLAAAKKARKGKPPKAPDTDCWSAHPEAIFYALMQTSVEDYRALRDAGIIVNGESVKNWPRNRHREPKVFCNDYHGPAAVNDLIHYLRDGGMEADLAEIGSTKVKIEEVLKKLGLEPLRGGPPPSTPESRLAAAMRDKKAVA